MRERGRRGRSLAAVLLVTAGLVAAAVASAKMELPPKLQAALFSKILRYDKQLEGKQGLKVLVAHSGGDAELKTVLSSLGAAGMDARAVTLEELPASIAGADVIYAMPGGTAGDVGKLCVKNQKLSVSGVPADAEAGLVSVSLGVKDDGRPQIVVNVSQASREGHSFSSQLLALAKVVR